MRLFAVQAIIDSNDARSADRLKLLLADESAMVRTMAAQALCKFLKNEYVVPCLQHVDPQIKVGALHALKDMKDGALEFLHELGSLVSCDEIAVRIEVLELLRELGSKARDLLPMIAIARMDGNSRVRRLASEAFERVSMDGIRVK